MRLCLIPLLACIVGVPALAGGFMETAAIDREVAQFLGAGPGTPGGASSPVDRRLRLAPCEDALGIDWYGRGQRSVEVKCPAKGWRIFVSVDASLAAANSSGHGQPVVARGENVIIEYRGRGFVLTRQGEAVEAGAPDQWIKVRPAGKSTDPIRARVIGPGKVGIGLP